MRQIQTADPVRFPTMRTEELRSSFLVDALFQPSSLNLAYVDLERAVVGGVVPGSTPLSLPAPSPLRASFFLERREMGVFNVGGPGAVIADGRRFTLDRLDTLYLGRGTKTVEFVSEDPLAPAAFYLLSYPAHASYPSGLARFAELQGTPLGAQETCNARTLYKAIHAEGIKSCQLVMGFTVLQSGSNWNTMPPHTHGRRSEIYFYFDLQDGARAFHLMGPPEQTRHLVVADREVVVSPGWSIHSGVGTRNYTFCWGMGGENQEYTDMDPAPLTELR